LLRKLNPIPKTKYENDPSETEIIDVVFFRLPNAQDLVGSSPCLRKDCTRPAPQPNPAGEVPSPSPGPTERQSSFASAMRASMLPRRFAPRGPGSGPRVLIPRMRLLASPGCVSWHRIREDARASRFAGRRRAPVPCGPAAGGPNQHLTGGRPRDRDHASRRGRCGPPTPFSRRIR
jgi:hypothetical protein